jgi:hypothetical protein
MTQARTGDAESRIIVVCGYVAMAIAVLVPLLITLDRFRRPFGEKFAFTWMGGSADLWLPYNGARALLMHLDPYMLTLPPELRDPSGWPQTYPPTMLLLYVPLVWATNSDVEAASQALYWLNVLALGGFCYAVWRLSRALREREADADALATLLIVLIALSLNAATMFVFDRGQSELINAMLSWGAVLLYTQKRMAAAMTLVTLAAAIKGYAAFLAIGLLLAAPSRRHFVRGLIAAGLTTLAVTLPVASHLESGLAALRTRSEFFFKPVWYNHSFRSVFHHVTETDSETARYVMLGITALVTALSGWRLSVAARADDARAVTGRAVIFATAALALMVGMPFYSGIYNFVLILPGLLLLATRSSAFARSHPGRLALGLSAPLALALGLMMHKLGSEVPLGGIALVYFVLVAGALSLVRTVESSSPAAA